MDIQSFLKDIKRIVGNLIITEQEYNEYFSTLPAEPLQKTEEISSSEEKKEMLIYYRSLLEQYQKTLHTLQTQRKNLNSQLEEHEKYKKQLEQDYETTLQKYKESSSKAVDTILPHFLRPFGRWAKKFLRKYPKVGTPLYFGIVFGSLAVIMTVPVLRSVYSIAFLTGVVSEVFYAMKGKFFLQEFAQNNNQAAGFAERLDKILDEVKQLAAVNTLASKNVMLNKMGLNFVEDNMHQCQDLIQTLLVSDSSLEQTNEQDQKKDKNLCEDTPVVSSNSSKVLQKSISKPKQNAKEST